MVFTSSKTLYSPTENRSLHIPLASRVLPASSWFARRGAGGWARAREANSAGGGGGHNTVLHPVVEDQKIKCSCFESKSYLPCHVFVFGEFHGSGRLPSAHLRFEFESTTCAFSCTCHRRSPFGIRCSVRRWPRPLKRGVQTTITIIAGLARLSLKSIHTQIWVFLDPGVKNRKHSRRSSH